MKKIIKVLLTIVFIFIVMFFAMWLAFTIGVINFMKIIIWGLIVIYLITLAAEYTGEPEA